MFGEAKIGSLNHGGYSKGQPGTLRLIRTICKSVSERGCEKSGRMVTFATYLKDKFQMSEIPLYPFLGNRFNIIFLNGGGFYQLYDKLLDFFDKIEKDNKLLTAVKQYRIDCRCLGLIHKLVTGPLWRKMEHEKAALNMSPCYQLMLSSFIEWANDASLFVKGEVGLFPEFISKDCLFNELVKPGPEIDESIVQVLKIMFNSFVVVSKRMLTDRLSGGKYDSPTEELIQQCKSVPTTNAEAERDFGMLDRLKKLKSKALDLTIEGIIMHQRNKTKINCHQMMHWKKSWLQQENQKKCKRSNTGKEWLKYKRFWFKKWKTKRKRRRKKKGKC